MVLKPEVEYYDCIFSGSDSGLVNAYYLVLFDLHPACFIFFELMLQERIYWSITLAFSNTLGGAH